MEIYQYIIFAISTLISFSTGYFIKNSVMKSKLDAANELLKTRTEELESNKKFSQDQYEKVQENARTQETLLKSAIAVEIERVKSLQEKISDREKKIHDSESAFREELELARRNGLSVTTYPYEEQMGDDGLITDDRRAEIGYKFQLFINGVPCFEAHKVPIQILHKKEVRVEKIQQVMETTVNLLENMAKMHPAIKALHAAPEVIAATKK
jgi:hypothetical protein